MKKVIIINGSGGVGKDVTVDYIRSKWNGVLNISTVDKIKEVAYILGWDGKKDERSRKFLSDLKDLANDYNQHSKKYVIDLINKTKASYIFVHSREPDEIKWFVENIENCKTLLVKRDTIKHIKSNHADADVENYDYDYILNNNGTIEELCEKIDALMERI